MDRSPLRQSFLTVAFSLTAAFASLPLPAQEITLVAAGDIEWSRIVKAPDMYLDPPRQEEGGWIPVPYLNNAANRGYLAGTGYTLETTQSHHIRAIQYGLEFDTPEAMARYPLERIAPVFRSADIGFANLETPLSDRARHNGAFRTPTAFADGLRWAGIDVVSTANNHALDAEGEGLLDTKEALWRAGVGAVGTGANLDDARRPFIVERNGIRVGFVGYAQFVNGGTSNFAQPDRPGVAPLDPFLIEEDIRRLRDQVDYVVLSFHWAIENSQETHPKAREFAHRMVDAGADVILGHHPHVPRGVETYKGKVIFYSFGNLIFGHGHTYWMDNYVARLTLGREAITQVEILPVAGRGTALSQPYLLEGDEARAVLEDVQERTRQLGTTLEIRGDIGVIRP